jgi:hypothetical protein
MAGSLQYAGDVPGWIKNVVWPAILKEAHGDPALAQSLLSKIAPNRNAAKLIQMFGDEGFTNQIGKDLGLSDKVLGEYDAYGEYKTNDPKGMIKAFNDQYNSMMQAIGGPLMQAAMPVMASVTSMFTSLGQFANANPEAIKVAGYAIAGVAGALIGLGAIAIGTLVGIPAAISGIAIAVGALAVLEWDKIRSALLAFNQSITDFINWISGVADRVKGAFTRPADKGTDDFVKGLKEGYSPISFHPGTSNLLAAQPIALSLNVDGRTLAQVVTDNLLYLYEHPTQGPAGDGQARFNPPANKIGT